MTIEEHAKYFFSNWLEPILKNPKNDDWEARKIFFQ